MTIRPVQPRHALIGLLLLLVLPLTGCAGTAPADAAATPRSASSSPSSSTSAGAASQRIEVTVANGEVNGDTGRVPVAAGTAVTLVVTSDVADQVHVHGYDIEKELAPGTAATLQFDATVPGVFEVELHHAETVLLRLEVS